jgi:hypothetical protein
MYYTPNMSRCRIVCEDNAAFKIKKYEEAIKAFE